MGAVMSRMFDVVVPRFTAPVLHSLLPVADITYRPHPLFSIPFISGYTQTLGVLVKDWLVNFEYDHESVITTPDGAQLSCNWVNYGADQLAGVTVVFPGLTGDERSSYTRTLVDSLRRQRFLVCVCVARGCGRSSFGDGSVLYNARYSGDFAHVLRTVHRRHCQRSGLRLGAVGLSLGANILCNMLADHRDVPVDAACLIGSPWHLPATNARVNRWLSSLLFNGALVAGLHDFLDRHMPVLLHSASGRHIDWQRAKRSSSVLEFDSIVTAPMGGYRSAHDYYEDASSSSRLQFVDCPLLSIDALDDPICDARGVPRSVDLPSNFLALQVPIGGHLGFIEWTGWFNLDFLRRSFADRVATMFFKRQLANT